jgi:dTDP-4-amino-4,6-dideoxygalactose transaminase
MTQHVPIPSSPLPFIDLVAQSRRVGDKIEAGIKRVLAHGQFIMGPEVKTLESDLAAFCGAREVVTCANGTDALGLVLMAKGVTAGQAVLCPTFTFAATAEVIAWVGATPIFIDVDADSFNINAASLEQGIATAKQQGLVPVGVIPVDLFGRPADYVQIEAICSAHGLWMLSDAAQSFGGVYKGRKVGTIGLATSTSFFPAKPLGCYGDGGAVFTDDSELASIMRSLRVHGQGTDKYDNVRIGLNARLDTIQAAVLIEKLQILADEIEKRNAAARYYNKLLADVVMVPGIAEQSVSAWAQYTIRIDSGRRDQLAQALKADGIPTAIYYPKALHQQTAYRHYPVAGKKLSVSEEIADQVLSLPMHPYLTKDVQDRIAQAVVRAMKA